MPFFFLDKEDAKHDPHLKHNALLVWSPVDEIANSKCKYCIIILFVLKSEQWPFQDTNLQDTVEPQLSGPRLSGLFDYPDFSGPVFFMNINKLWSQNLQK